MLGGVFTAFVRIFQLAVALDFYMALLVTVPTFHLVLSLSLCLLIERL